MGILSKEKRTLHRRRHEGVEEPLARRVGFDAGAPPDAIQSYLRVIAKQMSVSAIRPTDEYDIIVDYRRAETGESETGKLLYAGLVRGGKAKLSMIEWTVDGRTQWFEASGVGAQRGGMVRPTNGRVTSTLTSIVPSSTFVTIGGVEPYSTHLPPTFV